MGFFETIFEQPKEQRNNNNNMSSNMANFKTGIDSKASNVVVDMKTVKTIPAVSACLDIICGSVAQLPIYLYKENSDGSIEKIEDDYRIFLLNNEVNPNMTAHNFKKNCVEQYLMRGVSYNFVERKGNEVTAIYPLDFSKITVEKNIKTKPWQYDLEYTYDSVKVKALDIMRVMRTTEDGSEPVGLLTEGKDTFELALNEKLYTNNILSKGALPMGMLKTQGKLSRTTVEKLRESFENLYSGAKNSGKTIILEEGLDYSPLSLKPSDLNLIDGRKMSAGEICNLFNAPLSLILNDQQFTEQDNLQYMKFCISHILTAMESAFDKDLLLEEEKLQNYYFRFDITELERGTVGERYGYIEKGMKSGVTSVNEARAILDLPKLPNDYLLLSLGNIFYNMETGQIEVPNTGQNIKTDEKEEDNEEDSQIKEEDNKQEEENKNDDKDNNDTK